LSCIRSLVPPQTYHLQKSKSYILQDNVAIVQQILRQYNTNTDVRSCLRIPDNCISYAEFYRMNIKSFPDYKYLLQENYCTWNTNIFFSKCNLRSFYNILVLLLLHVERLIDNQFLSMCSPTCLSYCSKSVCYTCLQITIIKKNITINTLYKIVETNLSNCKKYFCISRGFLVINVCSQGKTLFSTCIPVLSRVA
jgi:hypothetical protein